MVHGTARCASGTSRRGLLVGEPWEGDGEEIVWALALSPNGNVIACGRDDGSVQHWNAEER